MGDQLCLNGVYVSPDINCCSLLSIIPTHLSLMMVEYHSTLAAGLQFRLHLFFMILEEKGVRTVPGSSQMYP